MFRALTLLSAIRAERLGRFFGTAKIVMSEPFYLDRGEPYHVGDVSYRQDREHDGGRRERGGDEVTSRDP